MIIQLDDKFHNCQGFSPSTNTNTKFTNILSVHVHILYLAKVVYVPLYTLDEIVQSDFIAKIIQMSEITSFVLQLLIVYQYDIYTCTKKTCYFFAI